MANHWKTSNNHCLQGNLPYLTYESQIVASLPSITQFVQETFGRSLDSSLTTSRKSQSAAWLAHADSHLGDLVVSHCYLLKRFPYSTCMNSRTCALPVGKTGRKCFILHLLPCTLSRSVTSYQTGLGSSIAIAWKPLVSGTSRILSQRRNSH